ncbi:dihydrofolate reductase family protein [Kribbella sp. VKM Ac-2566]|uniref:dihydrofolate reductase family protein n=1 Tax=Kribbella sp. VKM Ac-2566 TaxID=2512218 RepID=UPI001063EDDA|nr:dihydrofolate reductase family protein [Kribbella sp. VKM Ac-2566]TDW97808.1 dihydrofolate reductase [Kribbella sp. VKM Ac-2566]
MRDLIVTQNVTLDGVIEAGDWFGPADGGPEVLDALREQMTRADAFLTGRVTFEQMRGYWPAQTDDSSGISAYLNRVQKYVVSSTLDDPGWEPTTVLRGLDDVRRLKDTTGGDIICTGSIDVTHQLIAAELVDEYRLFIYPSVIATGRRLFPDNSPLPLTLTDSRSFPSGVALLTYRRAARHTSTS